MKRITDDTNLEFGFAFREDAETVLNRAKEIAGKYGHVTVADMRDLSGVESTYTENFVGWTCAAIRKAYIKLVYDSDDRGLTQEYRLRLPCYDWKNDGCVEETEGTGEPINITISSNEWNTRRNDIEQVLNELLRNSDKIKDRPVFISIM